MPSLVMALPGLHRVRRGAETAMEIFAREVARLPGWEVTVFGGGPPIEGRAYAYEQVESPPVEHYSRRRSLPLFRNSFQWEEFSFANGLRKALKGRRFDVSLGCSWPWVHFVLRRCSGKHVFWTQNGDYMIDHRKQEYRLFNADGLICTNPAYYERAKDRYAAVMLPNGVDPARFYPGEAHRESLGLLDGVKIALTVSALTPHKRVDASIRAVAQVPGVHLVVCGEGSEGEKLDELGARLMPGRYWRMAVARERMPEVYRAADVLVHPCEIEPSANVWSEALSSGLPVVAHDMPVTRWVLGEYGVLADATKDEALTAAIVWALARPAEEKALRHRRAEEVLAWSSIARRAAEFFEGLRNGPSQALSNELSHGCAEGTGGAAEGSECAGGTVKERRSVAREVAHA